MIVDWEAIKEAKKKSALLTWIRENKGRVEHTYERNKKVLIRIDKHERS